MPGAVKGSKQYRMRVVRYRPWQPYILGLAALIIIALAAAAGYWYGSDDRQQLAQQLAQLRAMEPENATQLTNLQAQLAVSERNRELDQQALSQAQTTIASLRESNIELQRDNGLYRQVMSLASSATPALTIVQFKLSDVAQVERGYAYQLLVAVHGNQDAVVDVEANIVINGELAGEPQSFDLDTIAVLPQELKASFNYLYRFSGSIVLPEGFVPTAAEISVADASATLPASSINAEWQQQGPVHVQIE